MVRRWFIGQVPRGEKRNYCNGKQDGYNGFCMKTLIVLLGLFILNTLSLLWGARRISRELRSRQYLGDNKDTQL